MTLSPIASVSAETGIPKEVLRKWEVRYGFPMPDRDNNGNRLYPEDQIARLQLISKLISSGMRPGTVVPLGMAALQALVAEKQVAESSSPHITYDQLVSWLQLHEPEQLRHHLHAEMTRTGLLAFVVETLPTMNQIVGLAWQRGEITLVYEHVYSEILQDLLRAALATINKPDGTPRVLVTTPVGELHTFGILMLQVFLALKGAYCMSLGAQTPPEDIALAVRHFRIDLLCLSISCCYPNRKVVPLLKEIRAALPQQTAFWAGGGGVADIKACPRGVKLIADFDGVAIELEKFLKQNHVQRNTDLAVADDLIIENDSAEVMPAR
jgi:hypothetical protein